jgi:hypothetical protein
VRDLNYKLAFLAFMVQRVDRKGEVSPRDDESTEDVIKDLTDADRKVIIQMKEDMSFDTPQKQKESEYWHAKSLEISCTFLPGECPLLNHINVSYQKHFAPVKTTIKENQKQMLRGKKCLQCTFSLIFNQLILKNKEFNLYFHD